MTAPALISALRERGARLQVDGDRLRVTPATVLTDGDRAEIRAHKSEILRALETHQEPSEKSTVEFDRTPDVSLVGFDFDAGAAYRASNVHDVAPDELAEFAELVECARFGGLEKPLCEVALSAFEDARQLIEKHRRGPMPGARDLSALRDRLCALRGVEMLRIAQMKTYPMKRRLLHEAREAGSTRVARELTNSTARKFQNLET